MAGNLVALNIEVDGRTINMKNINLNSTGAEFTDFLKTRNLVDENAKVQLLTEKGTQIAPAARLMKFNLSHNSTIQVVVQVENKIATLRIEAGSRERDLQVNLLKTATEFIAELNQRFGTEETSIIGAKNQNSVSISDSSQTLEELEIQDGDFITVITATIGGEN